MSTSPRRQPLCANQRGLTLIELIVFIVIVSTALVGVLSVLNVTARNSADPMINKQLLAIAESLLEEVQLKDFDANVASRGGAACFNTGGAPTQATRASFDCVSNYDDFPGAATGIFQSDGTTAATGLADYTARVTVSHPDTGAAPTGVTDPDNLGNVWIITITVTHGTDSLTLTGYRFNYG